MQDILRSVLMATITCECGFTDRHDRYRPLSTAWK
jgi:hypothetical protein